MKLTDMCDKWTSHLIQQEIARAKSRKTQANTLLTLPEKGKPSEDRGQAKFFMSNHFL